VRKNVRSRRRAPSGTPRFDRLMVQEKRPVFPHPSYVTGRDTVERLPCTGTANHVSQKLIENLFESGHIRTTYNIVSARVSGTTRVAS